MVGQLPWWEDFLFRFTIFFRTMNLNSDLINCEWNYRLIIQRFDNESDVNIVADSLKSILVKIENFKILVEEDPY